MKRYLSVKESAELLSVSTNTIYTYLKEGKIVAKRIGRGRFKIPYSQLAPFVNLTLGNQDKVVPEGSGVERVQDEASYIKVQTSGGSPRFQSQNEAAPEKDVNNAVYTEKQSESLDDSDEESTGEDISFDRSDVIFYRIFKAISFIGIALIYWHDRSSFFTFKGSFLAASGIPLSNVLPILLFVLGALNLTEVFAPRKFLRTHILTDALSVLVLGYYSVVALTTGEYTKLIFPVAFIIVAGGHLVSGFRDGNKNASFFNSFLHYFLYLALLAGIVLVVYPHLLELPIISDYVSLQKEFFALVWFVLVVAPLIYFLSPYGKNSSLLLPFFVIAGSGLLILATEFLLAAFWDISYLSFITGVFSLFFAWWSLGSLKLDPKKVMIVTLSFCWVSATLLLGMFALRSSRQQIKIDAEKGMKGTADQIAEKVNSEFEDRSAVLVTFAGNSDLKKVVQEKETEASINYAKEIYEKLGSVERVIIYNKEGIAVGVYPRNSLAQGTNFSSQDYFQKTVSTYKAFVSPVFENILGNASIIHTEPIFENNDFIGMIGVSLDLAKLAGNFGKGLEFKYSIQATDNNGFVVFDTDSKKIGLKREENSIESSIYRTETLTVLKEARIPQWLLELKTPVAPLVAKLSNMHIILAILLTVNSIFSVAASIVASTKRQKPQVTMPTSLAANPRFI
ncbi:hypothetical protein A2962_02620 [Candidatus Woesebacteria bacterium RIFCSPLOWO2_01_FULL_39_61]|uniref:Helix-turn-helix domain-containing protein n=1 Tax=Candidatus Woesebacteria bacterium RIFCSPHIGHO2_02_FULL_39_13 TaxID=1802505 RepID=A0A1F7Z1C3_9BACT|nr:MAG: hypothetical protein A2692_04200 [Candidatus Woesebacteria bacterium RIFCSPHIGHO2_01_FULL_39_95]OGM33456.1 MAG: hypothetical protein A3D01_01885 [Candidatus Woesebacteria bacterium RIFCSPHIGHO2_02_FULL_39_13]OGM39052.1 MAG: hypothetical protein A3E13_01905 [Candidatus Woesebacteria bacterium RIFCSPHIGHO2_12_FULL_40_20]OGM67263.1 MAG: hypothetical protein A2962_02620 [Candidatus Woesebacteria bacterium RIFCSPLOWO2_01_FULL_39_61]OGM75001.1 MAG: hypothetical protein A3H19_03765 [Candidatus